MSKTSFSIAAVEAYHVVVKDRDYWGTYRQESRATSARYVLKPGWRAVYGRSFETAIVKVTLADGTVGWGEATEPICPEVICRLAVHLIAPFIGGQVFETPAAAWDTAYDLQRVRGHTAGYVLHAMAAIDIAVWDALARRAGLPLCALLSAQPATSVPVYLSGLRRGTLDERASLLSELVEDGLSAVKLFVGSDTSTTVSEIEALRSRVGGDWQLMVDALWSYDTVEAAADASRALSALDVAWLECPLVPEDLDAHVRLAERGGTAIALGEHFFTHYQSTPWLQSRAISILQPDLGRTGLSDGLRQAEIAAANGVLVTPHMGSGSPIVQAAALNFWAATRPALPCEYQLDLAGVLPGVFETDWRYAGGGIKVPAGPGIGVGVDEAALAAASESIERWQVS